MTAPTSTPSRVLVTSRSFSSGTLDLRGELERAGCEVVTGPTDHALDELAPLLAEAVAWIAGTAPVTAAHLDAAPQLQILARHGVGTDAVDLAAAAERGVLVTNTPGANTEAVADLTLALLLAALRDVLPGDRAVRDDNWTVRRTRGMADLTVGIVGFGRIGQAVASRVSGFGSTLLAFDPHVPEADVRAAGAEPVDLDTLARRSDVVTLHAPGDQVLVDARLLDLLRPDTILVNTARAGLVDEDAVAQALRDGRLRSYASDVLDSEAGSGPSPLLAPELADRTLFTPHAGAQTVRAVDLMGRGAVDAVLAQLRGDPPPHQVRPPIRTGRMGFVGVSTGGSSIQRVFPEWADALSLPTRTLTGHDVPIGAPAETYRKIVTAIRDDPHYRGALVTTHKLAAYAAAHDLFDELDELARTFGEVSCIAKRGDRLVGSAKDPVTARLALEEFLPADHFGRTGGSALVLGAGGAGVALVHQLATRADPPAEIICTTLTGEPLGHARDVLRRAGVPDGRVRLVVTAAAAEADQLLSALPTSSLVVNATGMGKDRPGSPITDRARFPEQGVVWEFNYRGPLDFQRQALAQQADRGLRVEDGWRYFVHGWAQAVAEVFELELSPATVDELSRIAEGVR